MASGGRGGRAMASYRCVGFLLVGFLLLGDRWSVVAAPAKFDVKQHVSSSTRCDWGFNGCRICVVSVFGSGI